MLSYSLPPGTVIANKLRTTRILGAGGMGTVYEAIHLRLGCKVAVKVVHPGAAESRDMLVRFIREAQALARLPLDHIVQVLDVDVLPQGGLYMVLEYLDGRDLRRELIKRGRLPVDEAVMYMVQACRGVAAAHAAGIIHRDLKPQNMFLTRLGGERRLKLLDFGIAKMTEASSHLQLATCAPIGTPLYMAPEQLNAPEQVDERADIWALGIVLYQLLAGRTPFRRDVPHATFAAICNDEPTALEPERPDLPWGLEALIFRCLRKDREQRLSSANELGAELEHFAMSSSKISVSLQVPRGSSAPPPPHVDHAHAEVALHSLRLADQAVASMATTADALAEPAQDWRSPTVGEWPTRPTVSVKLSRFKSARRLAAIAGLSLILTTGALLTRESPVAHVPAPAPPPLIQAPATHIQRSLTLPPTNVTGGAPAADSAATLPEPPLPETPLSKVEDDDDGAPPAPVPRSREGNRSSTALPRRSEATPVKPSSAPKPLAGDQVPLTL